MIDIVNINKKPKQKIYFKLDSNTYAGIRGYDTISKIGNIFFINQFKGKNLVYNLRAESFSWDTGYKKWKLSNVIERTIDSLTEKVSRTETIYKNYNFKPVDLRKNEYLKDQLITPDLNTLITEVAASARAAGPDHPIEVKLGESEIFVLGDSLRIHQVIANLLANARTHTPAGTKIVITAEQGINETTVSVSDNGPGLSQADQEKIFERFYRADPARVRNSIEGSGLGLSIVDAVMSAHGGYVSVKSKLGEGSTFTLHFLNQE